MDEKPGDYELRELAGLFACYANTILLYQAEAPSSALPEDEHNIDMEVDDDAQEEQRQGEATFDNATVINNETGNGEEEEEEEKEKDTAIVANGPCSNGLFGTLWYSVMQQQAPLMLGSILCDKQHRAQNVARHALDMLKRLNEVLGIFTRMTQCKINRKTVGTEDVARLHAIYGGEDSTIRADNGT